MEQIQRLDAFKLDNSKAESQPLSTSNDLMEDQAEPSQPNGTDCLEVADSSANHTTGYDDTTAHDNSVGKLQSATLNAEESLSGNVSQSSSHDTWDSTNAFTRERPVLTGSERSTPTPVLVTRNDDTELVSQSIHIPCDKRSVDGVEMELSPPVNLVPASNDDTLFKKTSSHMSNLVSAPSYGGCHYSDLLLTFSPFVHRSYAACEWTTTKSMEKVLVKHSTRDNLVFKLVYEGATLIRILHSSFLAQLFFWHESDHMTI